MITKLFIVTAATWFHFDDFQGIHQIEKCLEVSDHLHKSHELETACVSYVDQQIHVKFTGAKDALSEEKEKEEGS
mgnify:CR=1 FL=1